MALVENIRKKIDNLNILLNANSDHMVIGGIASNLLPTNAYLTLKPFLVNAKIEQGIPWQLQTKTFIPVGGKIKAWATDTPVNLIWDLDDVDAWNSGNQEDWNTPESGDASVLLDLTVAPI